MTAVTWNRRRLFRTEPAGELFLETLQHYRLAGCYRLHAFVVMPDHVHMLLTPEGISLERALMLIKGASSHRLHVASPVWQRGFADRRMRSREEFIAHREYIHHNPVRAGLCQRPEDHRFSSAFRQANLSG